MGNNREKKRAAKRHNENLAKKAEEKNQRVARIDHKHSGRTPSRIMVMMAMAAALDRDYRGH